MIAAAKLLRCLQMIETLKTQRLSIGQLQVKFDLSQRTVYRYFDLFREVGYIIENNGVGRWYIINKDLKLNHHENESSKRNEKGTTEGSQENEERSRNALQADRHN